MQNLENPEALLIQTSCKCLYEVNWLFNTLVPRLKYRCETVGVFPLWIHWKGEIYILGSQK